MTREQDTERARELAADLGARGVRTVALTFVDNAGITRVKAVPVTRLEHAAAWGVGMSPVFDVFLLDDSVTTSAHIGGPAGDLRLYPVLDRLVPLHAQPGWAWAPAVRLTQEGEPYPGCQRTFAVRMVERGRDAGVDLRMAFEVEWFVGTQDLTPASSGPAYGMTRIVELSRYADDLLAALAAQDVPVEQFHPEYAPGQLEVSVAATDPVAAADRLVLVRQTIRAVSAAHGHLVSFAPVVVAGQVGNGQHLHLSGWSQVRNLFVDGDGPYGLTARGESILAGLLQRLPALCAIGSPSPASYLRLVPQRWAGPWQCWGRENREAAIRLVTGTVGERTRAANAELKCFDGAAQSVPAGGGGHRRRGRLCGRRTPAARGGAGRSGVAARGRTTSPAAATTLRRASCAAPRRRATGGARRAIARGILCRTPCRGRDARRRRATGDRGGDPVEVLIDGHCHLVVHGELERGEFEQWCTEADRPPHPGTSHVDSQLGLAVRRWCPPALGLDAHASIDEYLAQRNTLGWREATTRLLRAAGLAALLVDTGLAGEEFVGPEVLADLAGAPVHEVVRLERLAEETAAGTDAASFASAYRAALADRVAAAVAVKSIIAYRHGLAIPAERPTELEVARAAGRWLRRRDRLTDPVLLRFVLWAGIDTGLPVQIHTGFGDRDLHLPSADPALLQPFLEATEASQVPVVLLHCYPYHRQAGWLSVVYPHVYVDVGLTMTHLGLRAGAVLAEFAELAPFDKLLFSTDAYGLPELYLVGAAQFRSALDQMLSRWKADAAVSTVDAQRIAEQICAGNAARIYRL